MEQLGVATWSVSIWAHGVISRWTDVRHTILDFFEDTRFHVKDAGGQNERTLNSCSDWSFCFLSTTVVICSDRNITSDIPPWNSHLTPAHQSYRSVETRVVTGTDQALRSRGLHASIGKYELISMLPRVFVGWLHQLTQWLAKKKTVGGHDPDTIMSFELKPKQTFQPPRRSRVPLSMRNAAALRERHVEV